jgi:hypothetical protein
LMPALEPTAGHRFDLDREQGRATADRWMAVWPLAVAGQRSAIEVVTVND